MVTAGALGVKAAVEQYLHGQFEDKLLEVARHNRERVVETPLPPFEFPPAPPFAPPPSIDQTGKVKTITQTTSPSALPQTTTQLQGKSSEALPPPALSGRPMLQTKAEDFIYYNAGETATFGHSTTTDYKKTFFAAYPDAKGKVRVHHAVKQQVLTRYSGIVTEAEMHSLENLRGIPNEINNDVHLSAIRIAWNRFYETHPRATKEQLLEKATEIDRLYGQQFTPPVEQREGNQK